jgi:hypothetical protein
VRVPKSGTSNSEYGLAKSEKNLECRTRRMGMAVIVSAVFSFSLSTIVHEPYLCASYNLVRVTLNLFQSIGENIGCRTPKNG